MTRANVIRVLGLFALALACNTPTQTPPPPQVDTTSSSVPGHASREDMVQVSAVVESIDHDTRMVTLRDSDGRLVTFRADEAVRNLAQVSRGDRVDATYYRSLAIDLHKKGKATPSVSSSSSASRAAVGAKPGASGGQTVTMIATIRALDRKNQTATLESPNGELMTIAVHNPAHFDVAEVGDLVEINYTEASRSRWRSRSGDELGRPRTARSRDERRALRERPAVGSGAAAGFSRVREVAWASVSPAAGPEHPAVRNRMVRSTNP